MPRWPSVHEAVTLKDQRSDRSSFVRLADYAALQDQYENENEQYDELAELTTTPMEANMKFACGTITTMVDTLNLTPLIVDIPRRSPLRPRPLSLPPRSLSSSTVPSARSSMVEAAGGCDTFSEVTSEAQSDSLSRSASRVAEHNETEPHPDDDESSLHPAYRRRPFSVYSSTSTPPPLSPSSPNGARSVASSYSSDSLSLRSQAASTRSQSSISTYAAIAASSPWGSVAKPHEIEFYRRSTAGKPIESMYDLRTTSMHSDYFTEVDNTPADGPVMPMSVPERSQKRSASRMTKDRRRGSKLLGGGFLRRMLSKA